MDWWISWDKQRHTLTWVYGDIEDFSGHPVEFAGMQTYAHRNFCLVFPRIRYREWAYLMKLRDATPQGLVRPEKKFSDDFFDDITLDIFPRQYFRNEPRLDKILPLVYCMSILMSTFKWIAGGQKDKENINDSNTY